MSESPMTASQKLADEIAAGHSIKVLHVRHDAWISSDGRDLLIRALRAYRGSEDVPRQLLMRAVAYLPVPAHVTKEGEPMGVKMPDVHAQPSVEKLRQEILQWLSATSASGFTGDSQDGGKFSK